MAVVLLAGESKESESKNAVLACNDFLRMGAGRTLYALEERYRQMPPNTAPTLSLNTIQKWSQAFDWQERAAAYDKAIDEEKTARVEARRKAIMEAGLAQDYERVNELYELYEKLKLEFVKSGLWYTDTKLASNGDTVEVEVFNKALIDSLRATLDDLAKETGGRKQKTETEHSGTQIVVIEGPRDVR